MTFFDFPEHCLVEKKKKDKCHSSDAKDIQNWKKKKNQGLAERTYTYLAASVLMTRYKKIKNKFRLCEQIINLRIIFKLVLVRL